MAWEHLSINRPHLVYIILGGFTSLFMLCSSVIKERLYIGEATVATLCGIIFGPHAANLINPLDWGNTDQVTLEFARIVLVVQCFAVGVELPRAYMERHWKSVVMLLVPVMTFGWLITSLFIWWMFGSHLNWLDSLCIAACVTATDPVLASSVVGKGKFAKRVPKHLRDLLSAESGCNDGMAFPFVYLAIYLIRYRPDANAVSYHWFLLTILYECVFGSVYGVMLGYIARRAVRAAHERDLIDRESFLVFYFVLALFCAGSGSILGLDDLLVGFACGVGFSNDGWFQEKTEESHVSNVIDLLINLSFFVYFGTIIPWDQFNAVVLGISPWRLVVVGVMVIFFRRIPIMLALKPFIPDIKTWREALFAGHFGPIGVGAIFVAILARAELENETTTPLAVLPEPGFEHLNIIELIWPITTFLVICSIIVHGSSIAVFTLGKHINTLTLTLSYTQANEDGPSWMERLPRIQSRSKTSMSGRRDDTESSYEEKMDYQDSTLPAIGIPGEFLRRQRDDDDQSRTNSLKAEKKRKKKQWDVGIGPGGPISASAFGPQPRRPEYATESDTLAVNSDDSPDDVDAVEETRPGMDVKEEVYQEGHHEIIEDEEGNVIQVRDSKGEIEVPAKHSVDQRAGNVAEEKEAQHVISQTEHKDDVAGSSIPNEAIPDAHHPAWGWHDMRKRMESISGLAGIKHGEAGPSRASAQKKRGPALAYQFGNTIIVEDEDGEVIKKYDIPPTKKPPRPRLEGDHRRGSFIDPQWTKDAMHRMGTYMGKFYHEEEDSEMGPNNESPEQSKRKARVPVDDDDDHIRFTVNADGERMSKAQFIQQVQRMDHKSRNRMIEESDAPEGLKRQVQAGLSGVEGSHDGTKAEKVSSHDSKRTGPDGTILEHSKKEDVPFHPVSDTLAHFKFGQGGRENAAQRRRRLASQSGPEEESDSRGSRRLGPPASTTRDEHSPSAPNLSHQQTSYLEDGETTAERRRRLAALGDEEDSSSSSEEEAEGGAGGFRNPTRSRAPTVRRGNERSDNKPQGVKIAGTTPSTSQRSAPSPPPPAPSSLSPPAQPDVPEPAHTAGTARHQQRGSGSSGLRLRWGSDVGQRPGERPG